MRLGRKVRDTRISGTVDQFRESGVAYMIGARDDFAAVAAIQKGGEGTGA
jgi:hypothetical protein